MRIIFNALLALVVVSIVGCNRPTPIQPESQAVVAAGLQTAAKPEIDPTYANGETVYMIGPHVIPGARESMPNAYEHAQELYLLVTRSKRCRHREPGRSPCCPGINRSATHASIRDCPHRSSITTM